MSSPPTLAARPRPRPPPGVRSPGSRSPTSATGATLRVHGARIRIPEMSGAPTGDIGDYRAHVESRVSGLPIGATPGMTGTEAGATAGVTKALARPTDVPGAQNGTPIADAGTVAAVPDAITNSDPGSTQTDAKCISSSGCRSESRASQARAQVPDVHSHSPAAVATPTKSSMTSRHVAAFLTPNGPPLTRSGHLRQLLERSRTGHMGRTTLDPVNRTQPETTAPGNKHAAPPTRTPSQESTERSATASIFPCYVCGIICSSRTKLRKHVKMHIPESSPQPRPLPEQPGSTTSPVCHHTRARAANGHTCSAAPTCHSPPCKTYAEAAATPSASSPTDRLCTSSRSPAHEVASIQMPSTKGSTSRQIAPIHSVPSATTPPTRSSAETPLPDDAARPGPSSSPMTSHAPRRNDADTPKANRISSQSHPTNPVPPTRHPLACPECGLQLSSKLQLQAHRYNQHRPAQTSASPGAADFSTAGPSRTPAHSPPLDNLHPVNTAVSNTDEAADTDLLILCLSPAERTDIDTAESSPPAPAPQRSLTAVSHPDPATSNPPTSPAGTSNQQQTTAGVPEILASENLVSYPATTCRRELIVEIVFPMKDTLHCTEADCPRTFHSKKWSQLRHSLCRHLLYAHNIDVARTRNWCSHCQSAIAVKVSTHQCFRDRPVILPSGIQHRWRCTTCDFSCQTRGGFLNHQARHRRERQRLLQPQLVQPTIPSTTTRRRSRAARSRPARPTIHVTLPTADPSTSSAQDPESREEVISTAPDRIVTLEETTSSTAPAGTQPSLASTPGNSEQMTLPSPALSLATDVPDPVPVIVPSGSTPLANTEVLLSSPLEHFMDRLEDLDNPSSTEQWDAFTALLDEITATAAAAVHLPPASNPAPGVYSSTAKTLNDPKLLQKLYRRNRRRAVRLLFGEETQRCSFGRQVIQDHFMEAQKVNPIDCSLYCAPSPLPAEIDLSPFSPAEVAKKLYSTENSAPGHDRLTYSHWKTVDPDCNILAAIFNVCLRARKIPASWKDSRSILLPKSGNPQHLKNWRPIALSVTIAKLFCGCLARRLTTWLMENEVLSPSQKGFLPFDGVFENNYVVQQRIQLARTNQTDICLASLDLSNAFGSVPHDAILAALRASGVGDQFTDLIRSLYEESSTRFLTDEGQTDPIPIDTGVRQGCPLSGLLFNLTINPILVAVQGQSSQHRILAYADDLLLLAPTPAELQTQLDLTHSLIGKLGLSLNPRKCFSLHISGARPTGVRPSQLTIDGTPIRYLQEGEGEEFLGKPIGFNQPPDIEALNTYIRKCEIILNSPLAPWQRIDALKSFVFPSMDFDMRIARLKKTDWAKIDSHIRPLIKTALNLPPEAANEYLYGAKESACFAVPLAAESSDIARIDSAFKLLTSLDPGIQQLAWDDLMRLVSARLKRDPSLSELATFLSGSDADFLRGTSNPISSVWSAARSAARRLNVTWTITEDHTVEISHDGATINAGKRRLVFRTLRNAFKKSRAEKLIAYPNQGKAMECAAAAKASSHFFRNGAFTRFADWRFIHRARLNLVPLNGVRRNVNGSRGCRRCNYELETLPHVLCHCMRYSRLYQARHNAVVERIKKAASGRWQLLSENRPVRGLPLRPDIILTRDNACLILDVTIAFDNRRASFDAARREKVNKYRPLIEALKSTYNDVRVEAIVVGALGSWDPNNDKALSRICSRKYSTLMRKLIVSETISKSRDIYVEHLTDVRQED